MRISDWSSDVCSSVLDWSLRAATDRLALPAGALHDREKIMIWLQENWIVALVVLIVVIALLWWLAARRRPEEIATPTIEPATPAKPLEPARPDIVAAEPAFKKVATPPDRKSTPLKSSP